MQLVALLFMAVVVAAVVLMSGPESFQYDRQEEETKRAEAYLEEHASCVWWKTYDICVCTDDYTWAFHVPDRVCDKERKSYADATNN